MAGDPPRGEELSCPNCGAQGLRLFYAVDDIPVHSVLLMPTREKAVDYPRRDLRLGFCDACGFIANAAFDESVHEYSPQYEETQGFSPVFNQFADSLARRMIDRYDVRGKTVLEIGCGKGEFLIRMCEFGDNRGIGVDPSIVPERIPDQFKRRIEFVQDLYSARHARYGADFVCCRHTLEHIAPTRAFLRTVREAIGDRPDTVVFFELPETLRVLREDAFWDVYYEHCSYFTPGSLARLFRAAGFEIVDLELDFDDQYILLVARPTSGPTEASLPLENDLDEVRGLVERFETEGPAHALRWKARIQGLAAEGSRVALWGAGSKAVAFLTTLGLTDEVGMLVDINPYKQGMFMPGTGHLVSAPSELESFRPDVVVPMNAVYCDEIRGDLAELGLAPRLEPL